MAVASVILKAGREHAIARRHPWVFSGAVSTLPSGVGAGETVAVVTADGTPLGYGSFSPLSQICVRMLSFDSSVEPDAVFVAARVRAALARRASLLSSGVTDAVRLVNAESDGLPGVVVDVYAGWAVCQFTSAGAERWKREIAATILAAQPGCRGVAARLDVDVRAKEGLPTRPSFEMLAGDEPPDEIVISEGPCRFSVDVRLGHKTGFYLDQREARATVGALAKGGDVLNCFSYTGGFGLYARAGGAKSVTQVDISADAIARARHNEELSFGACSTALRYETVDVFQYLRTCRDAGLSFDLVVLDPPKFAATKGQLIKAARGYKDINLLAMKLLRPGGVLATFSCSGAMDAPLFDKVLFDAATDARRNFQIVGRTRAGSDHPVALSFPEGAYLKGVILKECS